MLLMEETLSCLLSWTNVIELPRIGVSEGREKRSLATLYTIYGRELIATAPAFLTYLYPSF